MTDTRHSDSRDDSGNAPAAPPAALSLWQIVSSTIAAALGVQSSRNRERDFNAGKPSHFIIAGIVFTVLFVVGMIMLVKLVLSAAT